MAVCSPRTAQQMPDDTIEQLSSSDTEITKESNLHNDVECEPGSEQPGDSADSSLVSSASVQKQKKRSTYHRHPWIITVSGGYMCAICKDYASVGAKSAGGKWITIPVPNRASSKLHCKADKHAKSQVHQLAIARKSNQSTEPINYLLVEAANKQKSVDAECMKTLFRAAYFMLVNELPHTTNWRPLVSTVASCDHSGTLASYLRRCPGNAHHLSQTSVTDIIEAFGDAIAADIKSRVAGKEAFALMADECTDINGIEMVSICIRILEKAQITEVFIGCWPVTSTTAANVTECIIAGIESMSLDPKNLVAVSFDGAANMSGSKGGVQALLKQHAPGLVFIHCRSHLLQLALVRSAANVPEVKRCLALLNKLYAMFSHSPKRLTVLHATEEAVDGMSHKLVQPGDTRWLSYDGSVSVVIKHYGALCLSLEAIYAEAGNLSCDAGGLLLQLRKSSTITLMCLLHSVLQPLARLSKVFQTSTGDISSAMAMAQVTMQMFIDYDYDELEMEAANAKKTVMDAGVFVEEDTDNRGCANICKKFVAQVTKNLNDRFSDEVSQLCQLHKVLQDKPISPEFGPLANLLHLPSAELSSEWKFLRRIEGDLETPAALLDLALTPEKQAMFPSFSSAAKRLLLLPIGTASVERSFSTMNRILCSKRCRLSPQHVRQLMLLSIEGSKVPDVRDGTEEEDAAMQKLLDRAYGRWLQKPRRLLAD